MWAVASMVLIFSRGVTCFNEQCVDKIETGCNPRQLTNEFPQNSKELETICRTTLNNMNCMLELYEACNFEEDRINYMRLVVDFLNKECDPRRRLFRAISHDLECLESAVPSVKYFCYEDHISGMWKKLARAHLTTLYRTGYTEDDIETCVDGIWENACTIMTISDHCEKETADAALEILLKMDYRIIACQGDIIYEMPAFIDALSPEENIEEDNMVYPVERII